MAGAALQGLYDPALYDAGRLEPSWWEQSTGPARPHFAPLAGDCDTDVAIIGGGYTGLSAAYHLARNHGIGAVVLEAGEIGWGASGRNAGFACLGAGADPQFLVKRYGLDATRAFYAAQAAGIALPRTIAAREGFDIETHGDGILTVAHAPHAFKSLTEERANYARMLPDVPLRLMTRDEFRANGFDATEQFGALHVGCGYGLNPLRLVFGLAESAARAGARIHPRSGVIAWRRAGGLHELRTDQGRVRARRVIVAGNGFLPEHLDARLKGLMLPVMSNIIVTRPLSADEVKAHAYVTACPVSNTRTLLYYFRLLPDGRFLFGGRGDFSGTPEAHAVMRATLTRGFHSVFPHWRDVAITHSWHGLISATQRLLPAVAPLGDDPTTFVSFGCHGNGVAWSTYAGQLLARLVAGAPDERPALVAQLPKPFFPAGARLWMLRAAYGLYRAREWLSARGRG